MHLPFDQRSHNPGHGLRTRACVPAPAHVKLPVPLPAPLPVPLRVPLLLALLYPLAVSAAHAGPAKQGTGPIVTRLEAMQRQLTSQREQIGKLERELAAQRKARGTEVQADVRAETRADARALEAARGAGNVQGAAAAGADGAQAGQAPLPTVEPTAAPAPGIAASGAPAAGAPKASPARAAAAAPLQPAVGRPPAASGRPPEVAPLFEQPGVLTPKGKYVLEPGLQFAYSSSNRVALVGYTVIPALLIGLVDVREVKRNTTTATLSGRTGLTNRLEVEVKIPYVYRADSTVSREIFTGTAVENVFDTSGKHMGDAEVGLRYQLNKGGPDQAYYVGALRVKSRTGRDPFEVVTDCTRRCIGPNATGTGLPLSLPTGSGFYSVQPSLTWLFPSDPAVFFGSVSYLHNFKRNNISRTVLNGEQEWLGEIKPGDIAGINFGMGLGLNDKASLSLGYDHASIARTKQDGRPVPGGVRTQLGTLMVGFSYRMSEKRSVNVSVGAGLTRDTPDVSLNVRMPFSY